MRPRVRLGAVLVAGLLALGAVIAEAKPEPAVSVHWSLPEARRPGDIVRGELRLEARVSMPHLVLRVEIPDRLTWIGAVPHHEGRVDPGVLRFPVAFRVPVEPTLLTARAETVPRGVRVTATVTAGTRPPSRVPAGTGRLALLDDTAPGQPIARAAGPDTVSGFAYYRDRPFSPGGFLAEDPADEPLRPVRGAAIELWGALGEDLRRISMGVTGEDGSYALPADSLGGLFLRLLPARSSWPGGEGPGLVVRPDAASYYFLRFDLPPEGPWRGADVVAERESGAEIFHILDRLVDGAVTARALSGDPFSGDVRAYWRPDGPDATFSSGAIHLAPGDAYDDAVILHEFGHLVLRRYSRDDSPGGPHYAGSVDQDPRLAWSEGWASYFQSLAREDAADPYPAWYVDSDEDTSGVTVFAYECEGPSLWAPGAGSETAIQGALWDLADGPASPDGFPGDDDPLERPRADTWSVLTGPLTSAATVTVESFWDGWFDLALGDDAGLEAVFTAAGMEYVPDAGESDEGAAGVVLALDGGPVHRTFFPTGDEDPHQVDLDAGDAVTLETRNLASFGNTRLTVLDPGGAVIAEHDDRDARDLSSLVSFTAPATGRYEVRVTRSTSDAFSGYTRYGAYDVRAASGIPNRPGFTDVGPWAGVADPGAGAGGAFADVDGDGHLDLVVVNSGDGEAGRDRLYRNRGDGRFEEIPLPEAGDGGAAWGDPDRDDDPDLFVPGHALLRNDGGMFRDVAVDMGLEARAGETDAAWADADNDGRLDLLVATAQGPVLWRNEETRFTDATPGSGLPLQGEITAAAWGDADGDERPDLVLAARTLPGLALYRNLGGGRFEEWAASGLDPSSPADGVVWGDLTGDGRLDLLVMGAPNRFYRNEGSAFLELSARYGLDEPMPRTGIALADMDLDGDLDLYAAHAGEPGRFYENLGAGFFATRDAFGGTSRGCAWGDTDGDGDPDLHIARGCATTCESDRLLHNAVSGSGARWLAVRLRGITSNREGRGSRVALHAGAAVQVREMAAGHSPRCRGAVPEIFGLGALSFADSLVVEWPSGARTVVETPPLDRTLVVDETPSGTPPSGFILTALGPAVPNPFFGGTAISLALARDAQVAALILDVTGRHVGTVFEGPLPAGFHRLDWNGLDARGRRAPAGIYMLRVAAGSEVAAIKMLRLGD